MHFEEAKVFIYMNATALWPRYHWWSMPPAQPVSLSVIGMLVDSGFGSSHPAFEFNYSVLAYDHSPTSEYIDFQKFATSTLIQSCGLIPACCCQCAHCGGRLCCLRRGSRGLRTVGFVIDRCGPIILWPNWIAEPFQTVLFSYGHSSS